MIPPMPRRRSLLLPVLLAIGLSACGGGGETQPESFSPLNYDYLPPIRLHVANISIENDYVPDQGASTLIAEDPDPPASALLRMLQHRLVPDGTPGNGTAKIENASLEQVGNEYVGMMTVRLDLASADGREKGYTEATVSVTQTAPGADGGSDAVRAALYTITKQLMDSMNVQLQYQIQHNLGDWISYGVNAAAAPFGQAGSSGGIQAAPLGAPGTQPPASQPSSPQPGAPQSLLPPPSGSSSSLKNSYPPTQPNGLPLGAQTLGTLPGSPAPVPQQ